MIDPKFWRGRQVFITGHTGFKGAWTCLLLRALGAEVYGFALPPESRGDMFVAADIERDVHHQLGDIRDLAALESALAKSRAEVVIHMAAQSLVRRSYAEPVLTYATNVMGTVNLLEAARRCPSVRAIVVVTSDKCYEPAYSPAAHRETDALGGRDPYSSSKGCAEIVAAAYRRSFFRGVNCARIATARAGNVIGGGDWAEDRLVPDAMRAFIAGKSLLIRNPKAVRPWQHVLDPVAGYLLLAQRLISDGDAFAEAWNFGPPEASEVAVATIADTLARLWGSGADWRMDSNEHPHETAELRLDCSKAAARLGWSPHLELDRALRITVSWYKAAEQGTDMRDFSLAQLDETLLHPSSTRTERSKVLTQDV